MKWCFLERRFLNDVCWVIKLGWLPLLRIFGGYMIADIKEGQICKKFSLNNSLFFKVKWFDILNNKYIEKEFSVTDSVYDVLIVGDYFVA